MQIERGPDGDFILDSGEIADRFGLSGEDFRQRIRQGLVVSRVERGDGEDAGTCRLSLRIGNRVWRAILDDDGTVQQETVTFLRSGARSRTPGR